MVKRKLCLCINKIRPFFKIFVVVLLSFTGIASIYSVLSHSGNLEILDGDAKIDIFGLTSYSGIVCRVDQGPLYATSTDCNDIAQNMAKNITNDPSLDCPAKLEYPNLFEFEKQNLRNIFISLITFAFLTAFFTILHDWRLIIHRYHLSKIEWTPTDIEFNKIKMCYSDWAQWFCCPFYIIASIFVFILYPFVCFTSAECRKCKKFNGGICRIAYLWTAIARFGVIVTSSLLTWYGFYGFESYLATHYKSNFGDDSPDYTCKCYCHFVLPASNGWGLIITTYIIIFYNLQFLYRHAFKAIPLNLDLLLSRTYYVPMNYVNIILSDNNDPTQSILCSYDYKKDKDKNSGVGDVNVDGYELMGDDDENAIQLEVADKTVRDPDSLPINLVMSGKYAKSEDVKQRRCLLTSYLVLYFSSFCWMILFTGIGFVPLGVSNANNLPEWLSSSILWIGIIVVVIAPFGCLAMCQRMRQEFR